MGVSMEAAPIAVGADTAADGDASEELAATEIGRNDWTDGADRLGTMVRLEVGRDGPGTATTLA
jgi:hypothetical protein